MPSWTHSVLGKVLAIGIPAVTTAGYVISRQSLMDENKANSVINPSDAVAQISLSSKSNENHATAIREAKKLCQQIQTIHGYPGLVVGVSIKGSPVWVHGFGFANIESGTKCTENTVMRIASISKPITTLLLAKMVEKGEIDLDKSIYEYLGDKFPRKKFNGKPVNITLRQLASHLSGIRHYHADEANTLSANKHYNDSVEAMEIFKNDDLLCEPGTAFNYSTYAYTVIAAVIESVLPNNQKFADRLTSMMRDELGMKTTFLDENKQIILNRSAQYCKESGKLVNAPPVDCSYKWAGGGILSSVPDLLRFGNVMLYSYIDSTIPGYLNRSTVEILLTPNKIGSINLQRDFRPWTEYGLGWGMVKSSQPQYNHGNMPPVREIFFHTGSATGGTTLLMVIPEAEMVVSLICNLGDGGRLLWLGVEVMKIFLEEENLSNHQPTHLKANL
ncbi:serine beta-lactamase-like protein LACTB, mitochondrial [Brevipalpus obovatus]|uniref:serine beta-lactamase-like protein LACTB, mitochondrial n=1 Tax=Brevipalpus obovatus TaxID=246614 RepID=UPI003D9EC4FF